MLAEFNQKDFKDFKNWLNILNNTIISSGIIIDIYSEILTLSVTFENDSSQKYQSNLNIAHDPSCKLCIIYEVVR